MSTIVSTTEASSLLMPDPPLEVEPSSENKNSCANDCDDGGVDKSGDLLNYEHDEEEEDEDELEALRMAALHSRKPKKIEQPAYTLKQHPQRNNLTQIVLSGPPPSVPVIQTANPSVALLDTSRPPPGYTPLSIPPIPVHGPAYGMVNIPSVPPVLTIPPPHPLHIPPPLHPSLILHHESTYHPTEYLNNLEHIRENDSRYLSTYHGYRDRSPELRGSRERRRSPYGRERPYREQYHTRGSPPGYVHRGSPGKERHVPLKHISRDNRLSADGVEKIGKFSRYNSGSENECSDESEEEVEEEVEVTASESENEPEVEETKNGVNDRKVEVENNKDASKNNDSEESQTRQENLVEADDVLNVDCTEEIDEFTNFLNEFEDELKEKPQKTNQNVKIVTNDRKDGDNKENKNGDSRLGKPKKTKIIKRIVKKPKRKNISYNDSDKRDNRHSATGEELAGSIVKRCSPKRRYSRSPFRDGGYSVGKYTSYSPDYEYKRRHQRTPTLSPEPKEKKLRFNAQHNNKSQDRNRSPCGKTDVDMKDSNYDSKSKSLPPTKALNDKRPSNSRGALSQSRDSEHHQKDREKPRKTPEEIEEKEFAEKLKRAETQVDRDRLLARRQKFRNNFQPIGATKKLISLKTKTDHANEGESFDEARLRKKDKEINDPSESRKNETRTGDGHFTSKSKLSKITRLPTDTGDVISLGIEDTFDMFNEDNQKGTNTASKIKGNVTDLRVQLYKKRLQNTQKESISTERNARDKLSKINKRMDKSSNSSAIRRSVDTRIIESRDDESEDDNLDPLERATVDDVSPRPLRQNADALEDFTTKGKTRLVLRDAATGLKGRNVGAFISEDNSTSTINESHREYSDNEDQNCINHRYNKKDGVRVSVLDRLGEPVHKSKIILTSTEEYCDEYQPSDDSIEYNHETKVDTEKGTFQIQELTGTDISSNKKSKREKRDKKEKKEKKKLKELKKLEKKLKKLKARKHQKSSDLCNSEPSETEDDYDDRIEYFMSGGDDSEPERSTAQPVKESKKSKGTKSSSNPKSNKRQLSSDSNKPKKQDKNEEDSDDELFAFFEKDDGQLLGKASSSADKRIELKHKEHTTSTASFSSTAPDVISKKQDTIKVKACLSSNETCLMSKMKKKNEKTIKRLKEIEEDKLFHR